MKKITIILLMISLFIGFTNGLSILAYDTGDLIFTINNPNAYGTDVNDYFGYTGIAIDNDYVIFSAINEDDIGGASSGKVYVFNVSDGSLQYTLSNPNFYSTSAGDTFGDSIAINDEFIVVSATNEYFKKSKSGIIYVFTKNDGLLFRTIINPNATAGNDLNNRFGYDVALQGDILVVGVPFTNFTDHRGGQVFVFNVRTGVLLYTIDNPNAYGTVSTDYFGYTIALTNDYIIASAIYEDDIGGLDSGKVYVFDIADGNLIYTLDNPNYYGTSTSDNFGYGIAVSGKYCVITAFQEKSIDGESSGVAYIYDLTDETLLYTIPNPNPYGTKLQDNFGYSVSAYGNYTSIGTHTEDSATVINVGKVYVYNLTTGELDYTINNPLPLGDISSTGFGVYTAMTNGLIAVSSPFNGSTGNLASRSGTGYVFKHYYEIFDYKIIFDTNGGTAVADITQAEGTSLSQPDDPTYAGFTFDRWYSDIGLTNPYTFTTMPSADITLYARWIEGGSIGDGGGGLTNSFGFMLVALILYLALLFLRFKTGARIWNFFSIGILIYFAIHFMSVIPMVIILIGFIIFSLYDTFFGGN